MYLDNERWVSPQGITVWGTGHSLANSKTSPNKAFQAMRDSQEARAVVGAIEKCDILVTHGPALGHLDDPQRGMLGCGALGHKIREIKPKLHVCGHVHQANGCSHDEGGTTHVNASTSDIFYTLRNPPIAFTFHMPDLKNAAEKQRQ